MNKEAYRNYFKTVRPYIKLPRIYKRYGILQPNFSSFLGGTDRSISDDVLIKIKEDCDEILIVMKEAEIVFRSEER